MAAVETVLAIDLGTSGPKVALVTCEGQVLGHASEPTALHLTADGGAEQDPADWWRAIVTATRRLWAQGHDGKSVIAACVTAQWAGTVAVDRDGAPLHRAIIWLDTRGARYIPALVGGPLRLQGYSVRKLATWIRRTGGVPSLAGKEPMAHLSFLREQRPEVWNAAHMFLEPKDWLNHRLCGRMCATYDSIALHWVTDNRAIDRITYDPALLRLSGLSRERLPALVGATEQIGELTAEAARELGLGAKVALFGGTPDVQSAAVGSGAVADYSPHLYLGTSSWLSCHVPFKRTDLVRNMASLPSALPGRYFAANSQETAGACVTWLRDSVLWPRHFPDDPAPPADAFVRIDRMAADAPPGAEGVVFSPWLFGERCPIADPHVRASFSNLSARTGRQALCRAVLEGVALNSRWLLDAVEHFVDRRLDDLRLIGGGANSALWCQIHADVLGRQVAQVETPVLCNARGAAFLALLGLGKLAASELAQKVPVVARYTPRPEYAALYREAFAAHRELWRLSARVHRRLAPR